jgi:polysaccharide export outer membrane protein
MNKENFLHGLIICISLLLLSCSNTKSATYFNNISSRSFSTDVKQLEPIIQKNDLLSINVSSVNAEATELFNQKTEDAAQITNNAGESSIVSGYLVDQDGYVNFPILGNVVAAGRSKKELRNDITAKLVNEKLLIDPIVDIRYLNYRVSVLGEVKNPAVLTIPNEKISLLEALGQVGDITIYGRRDNVTLIREENGIKRIQEIDLTTSEIFNSPYYYLQSNDIIYVQPNKGRIASASEFKEWIPVILSALSLAVVTVVTIDR